MTINKIQINFISKCPEASHQSLDNKISCKNSLSINRLESKINSLLTVKFYS